MLSRATIFGQRAHSEHLSASQIHVMSSRRMTGAAVMVEGSNRRNVAFTSRRQAFRPTAQIRSSSSRRSRRYQSQAVRVVQASRTAAWAGRTSFMLASNLATMTSQPERNSRRSFLVIREIMNPPTKISIFTSVSDGVACPGAAARSGSLCMAFPWSASPDGASSHGHAQCDVNGRGQRLDNHDAGTLAGVYGSASMKPSEAA